MATLTLTRVWLNLIATGAAVSAYSKPGRDVTYENKGEVRTYAGGRQRAITQEGEIVTLPFTLQDVVRADIDTLRSWKGLAVQYRDNRGRLFNGSLFVVVEQERFNEPLLYEVPLVLRGVSQDAGV